MKRRRCACRRVLLPPDGSPIIEAMSTVDRIRHARGGCDVYRTMERRQWGPRLAFGLMMMMLAACAPEPRFSMPEWPAGEWPPGGSAACPDGLAAPGAPCFCLPSDPCVCARLEGDAWVAVDLCP